MAKKVAKTAKKGQYWSIRPQNQILCLKLQYNTVPDVVFDKNGIKCTFWKTFRILSYPWRSVHCAVVKNTPT